MANQKQRRARGGGQQNGNGNGKPKADRPPAGKREWVIDPDPDAVAEALVELGPIGARLGGAFMVTPLRVDAGPHPLFTNVRQFETIGWHIEHVPNVPLVKLPELSPEQMAALEQQMAEGDFGDAGDDGEAPYPHDETLEHEHEGPLEAYEQPLPRVVQPPAPEPEGAARVEVLDGSALVR